MTADCVVFGLDKKKLKALLIRRKNPPFLDKWALPGGFVEPGETVEHTARRELEEETGLSKIYLEQLYTFSEPERDPREHVVTVAYYALVNIHDHQKTVASDASEVEWFEIDRLPELAFDHLSILKMAHERLRGKITYQPIGFELLPGKFPLRQLQAMYENILDRKLDKRNFRKKILKMGIISELNELEKNVAHRAAKLYRFDKKKYKILEKKGFHFEI